MARVLLVEFSAVDRFHRAISFPFVRGWLRDRGVPSRWIRFGLEASARAEQMEAGLDLAGEDLAALLGAVGEGTSHVLFGQEPAPHLVSAVAGVASAIGLGFVDDSAGPLPEPGECGALRVRAVPASLAAFLGARVGAHEVNLFDEVKPDFGWEAGNTAAAKAPSIPFLICGEECNYRRGVDKNPCFEGLDLAGCGRAHGCAFCVRPAESARWANDPVTLFRRQLESLAGSHPSWVEPLAVRAVGEPILANIEDVCRTLREVPIGPVNLLIDGRADAIVRHRERLQRAVEQLRPTPHGVHFSLVGIESFSADELLRYNKGTTWQENLDATAALLSLEEHYPGHFGFSKWGGLSLVLYSPWTRLQDLSLNLAIVRRARLLSLCGKVFTSRLRLYRSLPLYPMAARDGLLIPAYDDPMLDTARRNFYADELPWKFAAPGLESVSRVTLRLGTPERDEQDPLSAAMAKLDGHLKSPEDRLAFAEWLVDAATARPGDDAATLLARATAAWLRPPAELAPAAAAPAGKVANAAMFLLAGFELGIKPVVRLENPVPDLGKGYSRVLAKLGPVVMKRTRHLGADVGEEAFVGRRREEVAEAITLTDRMEATPDDAEWQAAAGKIGVLLGYPECCVNSFVSNSPSLRESYMWLHLRARLEAPDEVSHLLNPGLDQIVNYIPCSLRCERTLHNAERLRGAMREKLGVAAWSDLEQRCRRPWLLFVDQQGAAVELVTDDEPGSRLRYRAGTVRGGDPLVARAAEGDELLVDDQQILVQRRGQLHASLGGRAFLWWYRAAIQADFWRRMLALRFSWRTPEERAGSESGAPPPGASARKLCTFVSALVRMGTPRAVSFGGFTVASADPEREDGARVVLTAGDRTVRLFVAPRKPDEPVYVAAGPLGIHHPHDERIDTADKDQAVRAFAKFLETAFARARERKRK